MLPVLGLDRIQRSSLYHCTASAPGTRMETVSTNQSTSATKTVSFQNPGMNISVNTCRN